MEVVTKLFELHPAARATARISKNKIIFPTGRSPVAVDNEEMPNAELTLWWADAHTKGLVPVDLCGGRVEIGQRANYAATDAGRFQGRFQWACNIGRFGCLVRRAASADSEDSVRKQALAVLGPSRVAKAVSYANRNRRPAPIFLLLGLYLEL